jgi:iron(III) transport system substrate-binding protein
MERRSRRDVLRLAALSAVVLAACGSDDKSDSSAATTTGGTSGPTTTGGSASTAGATTTAGGATTTAAAGSTPGSSAAWDEIIAKAKDEGSPTIYSSQGLDVLNAMADAFEKKYGMKLTVVRGIDSENIPKIEAEAKSGNAVADVFAFASTQWAVDNAKTGAFVAPVGPSFDNPDYDRAKLVSSDGTYFISTAAVFGFGWNTDRYSTGLTGYEDLLVADLADGKIGVIDIHTSNVLVDFYMYLEKVNGPEFLTKLAAQKPRIYPSGLVIAQSLTSGEIAASNYNGPLVDEKDKGAPVDFKIPDGAWGAPFSTAILKASKKPNAAQLVADFMISPEGQTALARKSASVLPDIDGSVTTVDKITPQDLSKLTPELVTEYQTKWDALFKQ